MRNYFIIFLALLMVLTSLAPAYALGLGKPRKDKSTCIKQSRYAPYGGNQMRKVRTIKKAMKERRKNVYVSSATGIKYTAINIF